ncbi:MAG: DUF465 domain-containing protein [Candidatus Saccharicenans sp.]
MKEEEIKESLLKKDDHFKRVFQDHQECERALLELQSKSFLSEEDRLREKLLKKKKLRLKDEMYRMMLEFERRNQDHE